MLKEYSPYRSHAHWIWISSLLINVLALALPLMMLQVYDRIIPHQTFSTLSLLVLGVLLAVIAEAVLRIARSHTNAWIAARFEHQAMVGAVSRMLAQPIHQFERVPAGMHMDKFRAVQGVKDYYSGQVYQSLLDLPFAAGYLILMAIIGGWMCLIPIAGFLIFGGIGLYMGRAQRQVVMDRNIADQRRTNFLVETLNAIHSVKSMAMEAMMLRRYERLQEGCANLMARMTFLGDAGAGLSSLFSPAMTMAVVSYGAYLVVNGDLTNGELAACTMLAMRSLSPLQRVGGIWGRLQQVKLHRDELEPLFAQAKLDEMEREPVGDTEGWLELKGVSYRFPGADKDLLTDISLEVKPGECILIKGGNGTGRSTLLGIMMGMIEPDTGAVLLDGRNVRGLDQGELRKTIAYLPQKAQLFEGTILENLSGFDHERLDKGYDVADQLELDLFVQRQRKGWEAMVGDAAADTMPVGHRQRIAMARALSGDPRVVLFDETNTSVDSIGEAAMRDYMESLKGKATIVLITQRPSFQKLADRAYCLVDGRLLPDDDSLDFQGRPKVVELKSAADARQQVNMAMPETKGVDSSTRLVQSVVRAFDQVTDLAVGLPILLNALGWRGDPRDVAESLPYFAENLDLTGLLNVMAHLGFQARETQSVLGEVDDRLLPCLFVPAKGNAMILVKHHGSGIAALDAGTGNHLESLDPAVKGSLFLFSRVGEEEANPSGNWVRQVFHRFRPMVLQALLGALIYGLALLPMPIFVSAVYDRVIPSGSLETLFNLAFGTVLALCVSGVFLINRARLVAYISGRVEYLFGTGVLRHILSLPPSVSETAAVGAQVARISSFEAMRDLFTGPIASTILESPSTIVFIVALAVVNPAALGVVIVAVLALIILGVVVYPNATERSAELSKFSTKRNEFLIEMVTKMRGVREFGGERAWMSRFRQISADAAMSGFRAAQLSATVNGIAQMVTVLAGVSTLVVGVIMSIVGAITVGSVIASMIIVWRVLGPLQTAFTNTTRLERIRGAINQVDNLMSMKGERLFGTSQVTGRKVRGHVSFARVSFRYSMNADPAVLGATFEVEPGQVVAITGPNGAGKSTLLKLIGGLYQPQAGGVRLDDVDIRQIDPVELRRLIGYAPQETHFFHGTIAQNMRLVQPAATDDELRQALAMAGALPDIDALPKKLNTRIGDGTTEQLPTSLKQKISLARCYLTNAPVLLFDEPVNGLDFAGDQHFMEAVKSLKGKATVFFVTHRPSHLRLADQVMVFEGGYLRLSGEPDEVIRRLGTAA